MSDDRAELSTVSTTLDELVGRVAAVAQRYASGPREDVALRLWEVERSLVRANRQLAAMIRQLSR